MAICSAVSVHFVHEFFGGCSIFRRFDNPKGQDIASCIGRVRVRVRASLSFSGCALKLTPLTCRIIEPLDYRYRTVFRPADVDF